MHGLGVSLACACATILTTAVLTPAYADSRPTTVAMATPIGFSGADNTVVRVYFARNREVWTGIPPELARHFGRGKEMPAGIATNPLPSALAARLPARYGFKVVRVGQDVAMVATSTNVVVDVIENVFR